MHELKAEPLSTSQLDRWLAGKIPRRILVAPFGGPIAKARGLDVDMEYFDEDPCGAPGCKGTDFYGPYPELRATRDRLVDFHHTTFLNREQSPAEQAVKGAIMGRVVLDDHYAEEDPGFAGLWGDFWANAGEKKRSLIRYLESAGHALYGSTQPIAGGVRRGKAGHLCVWPIQYHTISTSPQNTYAIVPPLKAVLASPDATAVSVNSLRAFAAGLDDLGTSLQRSSVGSADTGTAGAKAGRVFSRRNEADIQAELDLLLERIDAMRQLIASRQTKEIAPS